MTPSLLYRIASVLLVLYALGHTFDFQHVDSRWGVDALVNGLRTSQFTVQGRRGRTPWALSSGVRAELPRSTIVTVRYFFIAPITFSTLVTVCPFAAAWLSRAAV
jgi:hypothetical protein